MVLATLLEKDDNIVLVTGGAGYIGSHTILELLQNGMNVIAIDNYVNSDDLNLKVIKKKFKDQLISYELCLLNQGDLDSIFKKHKIDSVIHFAALKSVSESIQKPLDYFENNISGTINLLKAMQNNHVDKLVFSSSATVYGNGSKAPYNESDPLDGSHNPYARTKIMLEEIIQDYAKVENGLRVVILRYFNPVGAHPSGIIGEQLNLKSTNIMPLLCKAALDKSIVFRVFGGDYNTKDGTCIRDYIHVSDLALGHLSALRQINNSKSLVFNLGTGTGYTVLELINEFENILGTKLNYKIVDRRQGDLDVSFADNKLARQNLNWKPIYNLTDMCTHALNWAKNSY